MERTTATDGYPLDLGGFALHSPPTCSSTVEPWLHRGFCHVFGFNHEESLRCFGFALKEDPHCVMAYLGCSASLAGNYNNPAGLSPDKAKEHAAEALASLTAANTPLEHALVNALQNRYATSASEDEAKDQGVAAAKKALLNKKYAAAMADVYATFPDDPDVAAFYAEALLNLRPWALWVRPSAGGPAVAASEDTNTLVELLEAALERWPTHPGLCHYYIHAMELGPEPQKAVPAARALRSRVVPDHGHLLHMPSHIDMWLGDYHAATEINIQAVAADDKYVAKTGNRLNFYLAYRLHNMHFVVWAAMFEGRTSVALEYARRIEKQVDREALEFTVGGTPLGLIFFEGYLPTLWHVLVRFGMWDEILTKEVPTDTHLYASTIATARYARGIAFAATNRTKEAAVEQELLKEALANPDIKGRMLHNNKLYDTEGTCGILNVAEVMLAGELAYREGQYDLAFQQLREAVRRDLNLRYDEPWGWMMPSRHALGALLLEQGHREEACQVFRDDQEMYPNNLWGLQGLVMALQGEEGAPLLQKRLQTAKQFSELGSLTAACFCATGAVPSDGGHQRQSKTSAGCHHCK
ncbi:Tetratricopeptide repeat protein [Balamuthia mandrillaris]